MFLCLFFCMFTSRLYLIWSFLTIFRGNDSRTLKRFFLVFFFFKTIKIQKSKGRQRSRPAGSRVLTLFPRLWFPACTSDLPPRQRVVRNKQMDKVKKDVCSRHQHSLQSFCLNHRSAARTIIRKNQKHVWYLTVSRLDQRRCSETVCGLFPLNVFKNLIICAVY